MPIASLMSASCRAGAVGSLVPSLVIATASPKKFPKLVNKVCLSKGKDRIIACFHYQQQRKFFSIDEAQIRSPSTNPRAVLSSYSSSSSSKKRTLLITSLVVLWYSSNIGVLLLNKYLLSNYGFKFPIFLTMCHMSACAILSYLSIVFFKIVPLQAVKSSPQLLKVATLSVVFCGSVVGCNISLRYLPVSFNQAIGATAPFFTAVFAYLLTFKRESWVTYAALVPVVAGVIIATGGQPGFHLYGFTICISATAARAFKSVLQGLLLSSDGEQLNSMNLLLYMSPIAILVLLPAALIMEPNVLEANMNLGRQHKFMWLLLLLNSTMAYSANLSNFLVTKHTSALTLQVLGNAKCAVAVVISILIFRNPVTFVGVVGYTVTVLGVVVYGEAKRRFSKSIWRRKEKV
ncbi:hypothetical protein JCGZ_21119 [Jatropha curcas]|uniref:Sugar phosphate transporter domain-containing protein n=1 Tax=Jatropha curcas TaxID=180498 RepID=A0A067JQ49_JATCU|nr:hypothetical protein JCGZ_21119 [Jatropha curcas]